MQPKNIFGKRKRWTQFKPQSATLEFAGFRPTVYGRQPFISWWRGGG